MSIYQPLFAALYNQVLGFGERAGMATIRRDVLSGAAGRVLEIGAGTGLNLRFYPPAVTSLTVTEPDAAMLRKLRRAASRSPLPITVVQASAENLPFPDASFDVVVCTLVLCSVGDLNASLGEITRLLAPGGQLRLVEHVRSTETRIARWQDRMHNPWHAFACGCHCNQDTLAALRAGHFETADVEVTRWPRMPFIVQPLIAGTTHPQRA